MFAQYADYNYYRYVLSFDQDNAGELEVGLWVPSPGYVPYTVTTGGTGSTAYYLHQVVYDPATATASYFMDGRPVARNWGGGYSSGSNPGLFWGAASSGNMGAMNYNLVEFQAVEPPFVYHRERRHEHHGGIPGNPGDGEPVCQPDILDPARHERHQRRQHVFHTAEQQPAAAVLPRAAGAVMPIPLWTKSASCEQVWNLRAGCFL